MKKQMILAVLCSLLLLSSISLAQDFPTDDITAIIGWAAGGGTDIVSRGLGPYLEAELGVNVIPINLTGAGGAISANELATRRAGYHWGLYSQTLVLIQYTGHGHINLANYKPVIQICEDVVTVVVATGSPFETFDDMIEYGRENPRELMFANSGTGALYHLSNALIELETGIEVTHVPYDGSSECIVAAASQEVHMFGGDPASTIPMYEAGNVRPLVTLAEERTPMYPDTPTAQELGYDIVYPVWRGIFVSKDTTDEQVQILHDAFKTAVECEEFQAWMADTVGMPVRYRNTEDFTKLVQDSDVMYERILDELGLKISSPN